MGTAETHDLPATGAVRIAAWVLRVAVAAMAVGYALPLVQGEASAISEYLSIGEGGAPSWLDKAAGFTLLALAAVTLLYPVTPAPLLIGAWVLGEAICKMQGGLGEFPELAILAAAARCLAPFALLFLLPWPGKYAKAHWQSDLAINLVRVGVAAAFIAHGIEAYRLHPIFIEYLTVAGDRLLNADMQTAAAEWMLRIIGVVDIVAGVALLGTCPCFRTAKWPIKWIARLLLGAITGVVIYEMEVWREPAHFVSYLAEEGSYWLGVEMTTQFVTITLAVVAGLCTAWAAPHWPVLTLWMAVWGLITAAARVIHADLTGLDEALARAPHALAPLSLLLYWAYAPRERMSKQQRAIRTTGLRTIGEGEQADDSSSSSSSNRPATPASQQQPGRPMTRPI